MELGHFLIIVAGILEILDLVLARPATDRPYHRARSWLTPLAVLLVIIALIVGVPPLIKD
jgi:hypothetical protein